MNKSADAFRTISEVAKELGLATHVLRFWESKFPQIKPLKRAGGRRYYRPDDVALLRRLQSLLHDEGYTIKGVQKLFREEGARKFIDEGTAETNAEETMQTEPAAPQGNLFDAPAPVLTSSTPSAMPQPQAPELDTEADDSGLTDTAFQYSPNILPDAPEPEPILDPDQPEIIIQTETVIQHRLSDQQKAILQDVLGELKDLKSRIDNVA